jgi:hypothetical protein
MTRPQQPPQPKVELNWLNMIFLWLAKCSYDMILPYTFTWDAIFSGYDVDILDYTPTKLPGGINALTFASFAVLAPFLTAINFPFAVLGLPVWAFMGFYKILSLLFDDVIPDGDARTLYNKKSPPKN